MADEFDDAYEDEYRQRGVMSGSVGEGDSRPRVPRLVSRLYAAAGAPLRARTLACLIRPLGSLGLVAVASGAFASLLHRGSEHGGNIPLDELGRYSNDQIFELARFVEQVSPEAIQQVAGIFADSPVGVAALGTAAAMLLLRAVRRPNAKANAPANRSESSSDQGLDRTG